jgi:hypothetical protein
MKNVKEYLDKNLFVVGETSCTLKSNGHYCVCGSWKYPKKWNGHSIFYKSSDEDKKNSKDEPDHISICINNEVVIVSNMCVNGIWSKYHYLQMYEHIPRNERCTSDEIIKYIDEFFQLIKQNEK